MLEQSVKLVSITPDAEKTIAYCARVSNPLNQNNQASAPRLIKYLIREKHWSPFEMAHMTLEIVTTRGIAAQILRHRSFCYQEYSQRYSQAFDYIPCNARRQDEKNKQNSIDDLDEATKTWFLHAQEDMYKYASSVYEKALAHGIAKECARFLLPLNTATVIHMTGNIRSWMHYIDLRAGNGTQLEHIEIALACKAIFKEQLPVVYAAMWGENE